MRMVALVFVLLKMIFLLLLVRVQGQEENLLQSKSQKLVGNNATLMDVHVRLFNDLLQRDSQTTKDVVVKWQSTTTTNEQDTTSELENILWDTVNNSEWPSALYLMAQFTDSTSNSTVHYIAFKVLWRKLKANKLQYAPKNVIDLYTAIKNVALNEHSIHCTGQLHSLVMEIRSYLIERSAQLLEVALHPANYDDIKLNCRNTSSYPVVRQVLSQLDRLDEDLYEEVLNVAFDAVALLENSTNTSVALNCLGLNPNQRLISHLTFLQRYTNLNSLLYNEVQQLLSECDMGKLPPKYLKQMGAFMPQSMVALHNASAICIHNITGNFGYLSECTQTTLMCTYSSGYKYRSVYEVERLLGNKYIFHSTFWKRYIKLETNYSNGNSSVPPAFIKNVYSSAPPSVWQAVFVGNHVALVDSDMRQYLCGGNQTMWSNSEQYAYTRRADDFHLYQSECLWLIEDCGYMI